MKQGIRPLRIAWWIAGGVAALVGAVVPSALAAPILAQQQLGTFQEWSFNTNPPDKNNIPPDRGFENPFGTPRGRAPNSGFFEDFRGQEAGLIIMPGFDATFEIPNADLLDHRKVLQLSMIYFLGGGSLSGQLPEANRPIVDRRGAFTPGAIMDTAFRDEGWRLLSMRYTRNGCPSTETVIIPGAALGNRLLIDDLDVTTSCTPVPEPSALPLFGLVALGLMTLGWRRHRRMLAAQAAA